jgi:hypothetical protein
MRDGTYRRIRERTGQKRWEYKKGFMIGVLICTDGTEFAAMSGMHAHPTYGFRRAAEDLGMRACATPAANALRNGVGVLDGTHLVQNDNPPLCCAAPKLVQAARAAGRTPLFLTERWYSPIANATVTVTFRETLTTGTRTLTDTFDHAEVVPSCDTCKANLTRMLCTPPPPPPPVVVVSPPTGGTG